MELVLLGGVFTVLGLACVGAFLGLLKQERQLSAAQRVTGELVGYETKRVRRRFRNGGSRMVTQYYPVVAFHTLDGAAAVQHLAVRLARR